jgi:hypothetical protein
MRVFNSGIYPRILSFFFAYRRTKPFGRHLYFHAARCPGYCTTTIRKASGATPVSGLNRLSSLDMGEVVKSRRSRSASSELDLVETL